VSIAAFESDTKGRTTLGSKELSFLPTRWRVVPVEPALATLNPTASTTAAATVATMANVRFGEDQI
jgi:hypothetical protein